MKKIIIFIITIVIIAVCSIFCMYLNYKANYTIAQNDINQFESYYEKEIYGSGLVTIINKAIDKNIQNKIEKDSKGRYIEDGKNTIKIDIKFLDDDSIHSMEEIYNSGTETFMKYYSEIKFKCTKIEYYNFYNNVKYMLFEQITE